MKMTEEMFEWIRYYDKVAKKMKHGSTNDRILRIQLYEIKNELRRIADALEKFSEKGTNKP